MSAKTFIKLQFGTVFALSVCGLLTYQVAFVLGINIRDLRGIENFLSIFDLGEEGSIPTWFMAINLLVSAGLLFAHYHSNKARSIPLNRVWFFLAVLFLLLSMDEIASLHNKPSYLAYYTGVPHEIFRSHAWVPFGIAFVAVVGIVLIPFLRSIDLRLASLMVLSGAIFLSGSLGFEFLAAWFEYTDVAEKGSLIRNLAVVAEETLEMLGIALFNCVLYGELAKNKFGFHLNFANDTSSAPIR